MDERSNGEERVSELVAVVVAALEVDPAFDVGAFLERHPEHAAAVRERLQRLERSGVLGPPATPLAGRVIAGRYRVLGELGRGGMGVVLRAMDLALEREVALKLVTPGETVRPEVIARFRRETRIHAMLEHPNIVTAYDAGETSRDGVYLAMRKVEGETLRTVIDALAAGDARASREYSLRRRVDVVLRVCDALSFAHDRGVVHRDLKPANVMIGSFGEVYLMDWGLAKASGPDAAPPLPGLESPGTAQDPSRSPERTLDGYLFGTPSYMSPEQARSDASAIGVPADVFGTGAMLYHALSGRPPYWGKTMSEVVVRAARADLNDPAMARALPRVPRELVAVCRMAMEPEPARRYGSIRELAQDLAAFLEARGGRAWRDGPVDRLAKLVRRRPVAATAVFALGLVGAAGVVATLQTGVARAESRQRVDAQEDLKRAAKRDRARDLARTLEEAGRDAPSHAKPGSRDDHEAIIDDFLRAFRDGGLELADARPVAEIVAELRDQRLAEDSSREAILDGLYRLAASLFMQDYARAAELDAKRMELVPPPDVAQTLRERASTHPELLALWLRVREILEGAELDPACAEVWKSFLGWVVCPDPARKHLKELFARLLDEDASDRSLALAARLCEPMYAAGDVLPLWKQIAARRPDVFEPNANICYAAAARQIPLEDGVRAGEAAKALAPRARWVWITLANCYGQLGELDRAEQHARIAIGIAPGEAAAHEMLGWVLKLRGAKGRAPDDLDESVDALHRAIDLDPHVASRHEILAEAERLRGNLDAAMRALNEGARACPQEQRRLLLQKVVHAQRADALDDAWVICREFAEGSTERAISYCQFAMGLLEEGRIEHAVAVLEQGVSMRKALVERWTAPEPESMLPDMLRRLELVTGAAEPGTINERNSTAQRAELREEYMRAFELQEELIVELEASHDQASWLEETGGMHPAQSYRFAARAAAKVARGEGFLQVPGARVRWSTDWPMSDALPDGGVSPELLAAQRPRLAESAMFDSGLRARAQERAAAWVVRAVALLVKDAATSDPYLDDQVLRETAREMLQEPCFTSILDQELGPGLGDVRSFLKALER